MAKDFNTMEDSNPSGNPTLHEVSDPARRLYLQAAGGAWLTSLLAPLAAGCAHSNPSAALGPRARMGFRAVPPSAADQLVVPPGYIAQVLAPWGEPIGIAAHMPAFARDASNSAHDQAYQLGMHHDGLSYFPLEGSSAHGLIALNHEYTDDGLLHPDGMQPMTAEKVAKSQAAHGVSIVEVQFDQGRWSVVSPSPLARRITARTPMRISGPLAGHAALRTSADPEGRTVLGTLNNCAAGLTPWGTYLACEENWAFYFGMTVGGALLSPKELAARRRYGVVSAPPDVGARRAASQGWHTVSATDDRYARWNLTALGRNAEADFRNEANTFGYNVEIDPIDASSTPVKRIAMGRFAHEACVNSLPEAGKPLAFYMGCDARNEYIYKFVTTAVWDPKDVGRGTVAGDKYLNEGKLYAAKFNADGRGEWIELTIADPRIANYAPFKFANQAEIYVNTRLAADAVGATRMDRPEWGAVNPRNGEVYFTLTNNSAANRTPTKVDAANPRAYVDVDGKKGAGNPNGHIIRFREDGNQGSATRFAWDIFLFGAEEDAGDANLSKLTAGNAFSSPDGLWFSQATGICWIQTDDGAMTDESNCMLLAAIPGQVGDGGKVTARNQMVVDGETVTGTQETFIGATLGEARLRRFLVAPKGAEVTGMAETPDGRTLFVNIQHPGEDTRAGAAPQSLWPGNKGYGRPGRPRSATIVITRDDGGVIGA